MREMSIVIYLCNQPGLQIRSAEQFVSLKAILILLKKTITDSIS